MMRLFSRNVREDVHEQAKLDRLEKAEGDLRDLRVRADRAIAALDSRQQRNHWREAVALMIQGEAK